MCSSKLRNEIVLLTAQDALDAQDAADAASLTRERYSQDLVAQLTVLV